MKKRLVILALCALAAFGCEDDPDLELAKSSGDIRLEIGGKTVFLFDPLTCQTGFDQTGKEFRIHNDDMSEYFVLSLSHIPDQENEFITGDLSWTTPDGISSKKKMALETIQVTEDRMWLLNRGSKTILVLPIVN